MIKVSKTPAFTSYTVPAELVTELNFFDLTGEKAHTAGTSNKYFHLEVQVETNGNRAQIYTEYGPTGKAMHKEWRHYQDRSAAEVEYKKILKSKLRKGYKEIDVAQRAVGSDEARQHTKAVKLSNAEHLAPKQSTLHSETARFVTEIMGATNQFVIQTLKCPLGQLTNAQIDEGRARLVEAKNIISSGKNNRDRLTYLTNEFYALIPHNLGAGARGKMEHLLLDSIQKITQKEDDLDTLLDAKSIGAVLSSSNVDDKYRALNATLEYIDRSSDVFKWICSVVKGTRASNHRHLGKLSVLNAWQLARNNEKPAFLSRAREIAKECGKQTIPDALKPYMQRIDVPAEDRDLYVRANILPLFHGTRTQNLPGILKNGLLIRPAGVVLCGAMYGSALYKSANSTKSINYTNIRSSYWASGKDDRAYLFLNDCALGNQKIASSSYQYTKNNIAPYHSVWAVGGRSGVLNDEMMLYDTNQHILRYVIEFECTG